MEISERTIKLRIFPLTIFTKQIMSFTEGGEFPQGVEFTHIPIELSAAKDQLNPLACAIPTGLKLDKVLAELSQSDALKVLIVAVPGAFTPTCTENHIPPYLNSLPKLKENKVGAVIFTSANDAFVLNAWGKLLILEATLGSGDFPKVFFASDPNAEFSQKHNLSVDVTSKGMGIRTARYALIVDGKDRKVQYIGKEVERAVNFSGLDAVLAKL